MKAIIVCLALFGQAAFMSGAVRSQSVTALATAEVLRSDDPRVMAAREFIARSIANTQPRQPHDAPRFLVSPTMLTIAPVQDVPGNTTPATASVDAKQSPSLKRSTHPPKSQCSCCEIMLLRLNKTIDDRWIGEEMRKF
jgi:hypothetical protein